MTFFTSGAAIALVLCTASCASSSPDGYGMYGNDATVGKKYALRIPPMEPSRRISTHDCRDPFYSDGSGNLLCI